MGTAPAPEGRAARAEGKGGYARGVSNDPRPGATLGRVDVDTELIYLRAGAEPPWERVKRDGEDVTARPEAWTPYQRERRASFEERVEHYRAEGLI